MFDPGGMRPFVERWDEVATSLIHRVRTEATGRVIDEKTKELLAALLAYSDVSIASRPGGHTARQNRPASRDEDHRATGATSILPMIPISFRKSLQRTGPQPREQTVSDSADESRTDSARHPATGNVRGDKRDGQREESESGLDC